MFCLQEVHDRCRCAWPQQSESSTRVNPGRAEGHSPEQLGSKEPAGISVHVEAVID